MPLTVRSSEGLGVTALLKDMDLTKTQCCLGVAGVERECGSEIGPLTIQWNAVFDVRQGSRRKNLALHRGNGRATGCLVRGCDLKPCSPWMRLWETIPSKNHLKELRCPRFILLTGYAVQRVGELAL